MNHRGLANRQPPRPAKRGGETPVTGQRAWRLWALLLLWSVSASAAAAEATGPTPTQLVASPEPGWPQWRGPRRDGRCDETGLLAQWPEGGPKLLWTAQGIGRGYSAPIITGGRIYLTGDTNGELRIFALDLTGRPFWEANNGGAWKDPYPGARAACAYRAGRLFHLNAHGRVTCLDAATGAEVWAVNVLERFGAKVPTWGIGECLLVDDQRVIVTPGGAKALMAALDVKTGQTVWTTEPLLLGVTNNLAHQRLPGASDEADTTGYVSPILLRQGTQRQIVNCSRRHVFSVDADTGVLLWTRPMPTRYSVIAATPVLCEEGVFVTAPDGEGGRLFRGDTRGKTVRVAQLWTSPLDTCHGGLVFEQGCLYGSGYRARKGWSCLDARTGETRWQTDQLAIGSVLYADGRLYCLTQEGVMALVNANPKNFQLISRFRLVPESQGDVWTHPVIQDRRLYLRYHERLFCYDLQAK